MPSFRKRLQQVKPLAAVAAIVCLLAGIVVEAQAQAPTFNENRPGSVRPTLPEPTPAPTGEPLITLPPITLPKGPGVPAGPRVFIREIRVVGNTVLPQDDIGGVIRPFLNRELASSDLQSIREQLTLLYIRKGYINSGAIIPEQDVVRGVVTFQMVEGKLNQIDVVGLKYLEPDYVAGRLQPDQDKPLHVPSLEERMQILLQDPLVQRLNVELGPGLRPGESRLRVQVDEGNQVRLDTIIANDRSPNIGTNHGGFQVTATNLTGHGDPLSLQLNKTLGQYDAQIDYSYPITNEDTRIHGRASYYASTVIDPDFKALDIESTAKNIEVGLSHPIFRTPTTQLRVGGTFVNRWSNTFLLDEPFSFSQGVDNGETKLTILRFTQDFVDRTPDRVIAARSTFSFGIDALGATNLPGKPDAKFATWLGQFQYLRRFYDFIELVYRTDVQLASDPLFSIEQFAVGGINTVRGFRENLVVRDSALVTSIEPRFTLYRFPLPLIGDEEKDGAIQLAPFFDYGRAWSADGGTIPANNLASIGIGLRWQPFGNMQTELYWGHSILEPQIDPARTTLQDKGIHFRITTRLY